LAKILEILVWTAFRGFLSLIHNNSIVLNELMENQSTIPSITIYFDGFRQNGSDTWSYAGVEI